MKPLVKVSKSKADPLPVFRIGNIIECLESGKLFIITNVKDGDEQFSAIGLSHDQIGERFGLVKRFYQQFTGTITIEL